MKRLPYRVRPRTSSQAALRKVNQDLGLFGPAVYLPAAEELAAMGLASPSTRIEPDMALERWITHPDERVPIALLADHSELLWPHRDLPIAMYRRAIREADAAGEVWSPLLDVLEVRGWWPMQPGACVLRFDAYNSRLPGHSAREDPVQPAVRLQRLADWLSAQKDARRLLPLRAFASNPLRDRVASSAGALDRTVMESLLPDPRHWFELAQNPKFGPDALQFIEGSLRTWFDSDHDSAWVVAAAAALERLDRERGIHVRLDLVRRSIQAIPSLTEASRLLPDPKLEQWYL